nr:MAG: nonstructural protein [Microvirus sp.]
MIRKVYSVMDEKAKAYAQPFFLEHDGMALRAFNDVANDPQSNICKHAADFTLWKLGEFDDVSGIFRSVKPEFLAKAVDFKVVSK